MMPYKLTFLHGSVIQDGHHRSTLRLLLVGQHLFTEIVILTHKEF